MDTMIKSLEPKDMIFASKDLVDCPSSFIWVALLMTLAGDTCYYIYDGILRNADISRVRRTT
jgi:hypothetical protein